MNPRRLHPSWTMGLSSLALLPLSAITVRAEIYLSEDQAVHLLFSQDLFTLKEFSLTPDQVTRIKAKSGQSVSNPRMRVYISHRMPKKIVFIDKVLGKHELITYAVGILPDGNIQGIEILEFRERYGSAVKNADWRRQFSQKNIQAELKVGSDIKNISGATLSSVSVTQGVRRLVYTYEEIKNSW